MLRLIFVLLITASGLVLTFRSTFYALLFYIWNAYFRPEVWVWEESQDLIYALNLSFLAGAYVVLATLVSTRKWPFNFNVFVLVLFLLHCLASTLASTDFNFSWLYWKDFFRILLISYLFLVLVADQSRLRLLILTMALSLGFEGAKQGWAQMFINPGALNMNRVPFLGDNNGVAVGMLMLAPLFGALAQTTENKWAKRFYRFMLIGVVYRALTTYSRGGFLACGTLAFIYWIRSRHKVRVLAGILVASTIVLPVMPDAFWERMHSILTFEEDEDVSAMGRVHFWEVGVDMAKAHPFLGVGFNAYTRAYDTHDFTKGDHGTGKSVHSVWFGVLAETGYVGFALYVILFACALRNCSIARKAGLRDPTLRNLTPIATSFESSLFVFIVGGLFLSFQYNEMMLHFLATTMVLRRLVPAPAAKVPFELAGVRDLPARPLAPLTVTR